jgi:hypothetical protein
MTLRWAAVLAALAAAGGAEAGPCPAYGVHVEKNDLVPREEVARWASDALAREGILGAGGACFVHVALVAMPLTRGKKEAGWVAHVAVSARRRVDAGRQVVVEHETGKLMIAPRREELAADVRSYVEASVANLGDRPAGAAPR